MSATIREWESAEIERSSKEASRIGDAELLLGETNVRRYLAPPPNAAHPLEYAYHLLGDVGNKVVLDFGCGTGENSLVLARRGARVIGFDISESLVRLAERRMDVNRLRGRATFMAASAHELPFATGSIDVVFGIAILHHLDLSRVAAETRRVLVDGGRAIFQEPVRNSRLVRTVRAMIPYQQEDVSPYERPLTDAELAQFASPFSRFRVKAFCLPHVSVASVIRPMQRLIPSFYQLDRLVLGACPWLIPYAGIRVIEVVK